MVQFDNKGLIEIRKRDDKIILEYSASKLAWKAYINEFGRVMNVANKFKEMDMKQVGKITSYFDKLGVAVLKLEKDETLKIGDKIKIIGNTTDIEQIVESMQINKKDVKKVKPGDDVGIKVSVRVRKNDKVYRID